MKKMILLLLCFLGFVNLASLQTNPDINSCYHEDMLEYNSTSLEGLTNNEAFIRVRVAKIQQDRLHGKLPKGNGTYTIPVVIHVYHNGEDGLLDMDQIQSGLDIINSDIKGLNDDWDMIDPAFDAIKSSMDIELCLATLDPDGNPTTGVNYYDNEDAMLNNTSLSEFAWDNYKYLNIHLPKYLFGEPSEFTAYANFPDTLLSDNNRDGIFFSSIRWGHGAHSEIEEGSERASIGTHELGHWLLNLHHTFHLGCDGNGDEVEDTPPTSVTGLELEGCYNNDFSCGVATNGSNYMDYNINCKKMFTQGQIDRMTAALEHPARITIWSEENLIATGCAEAVSTTFVTTTNNILVSPNPTQDVVRFTFVEQPQQLLIFDGQGRIVKVLELKIGSSILTEASEGLQTSLDVNAFPAGMYFYHAIWSNSQQNGRFSVQ